MTKDDQATSLRQLSRDYHEGRINYDRYQAERAKLLDGASGWGGEGSDTAPDQLNDLTTTEPTTPRTVSPSSGSAPRERPVEPPQGSPAPAPSPDWRWVIGAFLLGQVSMAVLFLLFR